MNPIATEPQPTVARAPGAGALRPLAVGVAVTALAAVLSYVVYEAHAATAVAFCFFLAAYALVLRGNEELIRHHGAAFGGLFEPTPLEPRRIVRDTGCALLWALAACAVLLPPFWAGFVLWWQPSHGFRYPGLPSPDEAISQLLVIAVPEELFYRGYLQTALDDGWPKRVRVLGADVGAGLLLSSAIFALGHVATDVHPARLMVFFPSLVFGWLRARSGGIGASILFHAACNLFSAFIARGYFVH
jgi:uncharacterized protein